MVLPVGRTIAYKFICDGEAWKYDPAQPWEADDYANINNVIHVASGHPTVTTSGNSGATSGAGGGSAAAGPPPSLSGELVMPSPRLQASAEPFLAWATPSEAIRAARGLPKGSDGAVDPMRAAQRADERMYHAEFGLDPDSLTKQQAAVTRSRSAAEFRRMGEEDGFGGADLSGSAAGFDGDGTGFSGIPGLDIGAPSLVTRADGVPRPPAEVGGAAGDAPDGRRAPGHLRSASSEAHAAAIDSVYGGGGAAAGAARRGKSGRGASGAAATGIADAGAEAKQSWQAQSPGRTGSGRRRRRRRPNSPSMDLSRRLAAAVAPGRSGAEACLERGTSALDTDDGTEGTERSSPFADAPSSEELPPAPAVEEEAVSEGGRPPSPAGSAPARTAAPAPTSVTGASSASAALRRARATGETGTEASSRREGKLVLAMVGLPARGKTSIAFKLRRHLNWMGMRTEIYNVGNYRRKLLGSGQSHAFFNPSNAEAMGQRQAMAEAALQDMVVGLRTKLDVAIFDATNTTRSRRAWLSRRLNEEFCVSAEGGATEGAGGDGSPAADEEAAAAHAAAAAGPGPGSTSPGGPRLMRPRAESASSTAASRAECGTGMVSMCQLVFIESICTDEAIIRGNVRETKLKSPDYAHVPESEAVADFLRRIGHYVAVYEPVEDDEGCAYTKLIDVGRKLVAHEMSGFLKARLLFFLSNLRITPKPIWITRHGESEYNVRGLIGGDSNLSSRGVAYAKRLAAYMDLHYPPGTPLTVWTSTLRRTQQTASYLGSRRPIAWRNLDEIDAGICDGKTYEWIAKHMPKEYDARRRDKYRYRYPQGESYQDLAQRLEPIMLEVERLDSPILIIAHQATLRVLLGYLHDKDPAQCPSLNVPLHTLIQVTPKAYGVEEVRYSLG